LPVAPGAGDIRGMESHDKQLIVVGDRVLISPEEGEERSRVTVPARRRRRVVVRQRAAEETLKEAERITRKGITINTFMLDDSPVLRGFVDDLTRINRGRAFYTRPDRLGQYLLVDYLSHQRKKV
jgi:hypothetical protein